MNPKLVPLANAGGTITNQHRKEVILMLKRWAQAQAKHQGESLGVSVWVLHLWALAVALAIAMT